MEQRLPELVLDVEIGRRREDEVRHLVSLVAERVDDALGRAHHADDLEVGPDLAALATLEHEPHRFALALRYRGKADVHHVHAYVGQHPGQLVLVLRGDRNAGHLFPVAKGVVVDADLVRRRKDEIVPESRGISSQLFERLLQLDGLVYLPTPWGGPACLRSGRAGVGGFRCHQRWRTACRRSARRLRTQGTSPPMRSSSFMNGGNASVRYSSLRVKSRMMPCSRSTSSSSPSTTDSAAWGDCRIG